MEPRRGRVALPGRAVATAVAPTTVARIAADRILWDVTEGQAGVGVSGVAGILET